MNGLLIGRFQPFHIGHLFAVKFALSKVEKLWIGIGSSNKSHEKRDPFTADERKEMILSSLDHENAKKIQVYYVPDTGDHDKWTYHVDTIVPKYDIVFSNDDFTLSLYKKRGIETIPVSLLQRETVSGTNIREMIAEDKDWSSLVPQGTKNVLLRINAKQRLSKIL